MPNAFKCKEHKPVFNPNKPDEYYFDVKLVDRIKKIGDGEDDYVIEKREVITKTKIDEVIQAQADEVGLDNLLKKFAVTGDETIISGLKIPEDGVTYDVTGMPQDLIEADNYFKAMKAKFDALPEELKQGRDFSAFMATINQQQFDAYIASLQPKAPEKPKEGGAE